MELNIDEIVKALECCIGLPLCDDCPRLPTNCHILEDALALIKKLTEDNTKLANLLLEKDVIILEQGKFVEENERLKTELRKTAQKLKTVEEVNEKLTADIEWLKRPRYNVHPDGKIEMIPTIKQFADRLKRYYDENEKYLGYSIAYNIDRVAEEMIKGAGATDNKCVACGETIPEGRQVCPGCEGGEK